MSLRADLVALLYHHFPYPETTTSIVEETQQYLEKEKNDLREDDGNEGEENNNYEEDDEGNEGDVKKEKQWWELDEEDYRQQYEIYAEEESDDRAEEEEEVAEMHLPISDGHHQRSTTNAANQPMWYGFGWYVSGRDDAEKGNKEDEDEEERKEGDRLAWHAASGCGFAAYFLRTLKRSRDGGSMSVIGLSNLEEMDVGAVVEAFYSKYYSPYWQWIKRQGGKPQIPSKNI